MENSTKILLNEQGLQLACFKSGNGPLAMVTFHGFDQDHNAFQSLQTKNEDIFTFFHFHLPFHGESIYFPPKKAIKPDLFHILFSRFLEEQEIQRFSLISFSIGAKLAVNLLTAFDSRIEALYFISPEGISVNQWYRLATLNRFNRWVFLTLLKHKQPISGLLDFFSTWIGLSRSGSSYLSALFRDAAKREQIVHTWLSLRRFNWDEMQFLKVIEKSKIQVYLLAGIRDEISNTGYHDRLALKSIYLNSVKLEGNHFSVLKPAVDLLSEKWHAKTYPST